MTRNVVKKKINMIHNKHMEIIKNELKNIKYVCTTADVWTAPNRRILGVTAHWVNILELQNYQD